MSKFEVKSYKFSNLNSTAAPHTNGISYYISRPKGIYSEYLWTNLTVQTNCSGGWYKTREEAQAALDRYEASQKQPQASIIGRTKHIGHAITCVEFLKHRLIRKFKYHWDSVERTYLIRSLDYKEHDVDICRAYLAGVTGIW